MNSSHRVCIRKPCVAHGHFLKHSESELEVKSKWHILGTLSVYRKSEWISCAEITPLHLSPNQVAGRAAGTRVTGRSSQIWGRVHTVIFQTCTQSSHLPLCRGTVPFDKANTRKSRGQREAKTDCSSQMRWRFLAWFLGFLDNNVYVSFQMCTTIRRAGEWTLWRLCERNRLTWFLNL